MTGSEIIKPGDHLVYDCGGYSHHGIYCGDFHYNNRFYKNVVIHYQGKTKNGQIRGISYEKFASEKDIYIVQYKEGSCYSDKNVVNRAISKLGEADYNLFGNNCEHFAHWCKTGKKISISIIKPGDHLVYDCGAYYHHGIYCGDFHYNNRFYKDVVIHYQGKTKSGQIRGISYEKFASGKDIYGLSYKEGSCYSDEIVVNRAIRKLGEPDYNLFGNNCEHFAHWCKTGKKRSDQVNEAIKLAGGVGGGAVGVVAVVLLPAVALPGGAVAAVVSGLSAGVGVYKLGESAASLFTKSTYYDTSSNK